MIFDRIPYRTLSGRLPTSVEKSRFHFRQDQTLVNNVVDHWYSDVWTFSSKNMENNHEIMDKKGAKFELKYLL